MSLRQGCDLSPLWGYRAQEPRVAWGRAVTAMLTAASVTGVFASGSFGLSYEQCFLLDILAAWRGWGRFLSPPLPVSPSQSISEGRDAAAGPSPTKHRHGLAGPSGLLPAPGDGGRWLWDGSAVGGEEPLGAGSQGAEGRLPVNPETLLRTDAWHRGRNTQRKLGPRHRDPSARSGELGSCTVDGVRAGPVLTSQVGETQGLLWSNIRAPDPVDLGVPSP